MELISRRYWVWKRAGQTWWQCLPFYHPQLRRSGDSDDGTLFFVYHSTVSTTELQHRMRDRSLETLARCISSWDAGTCDKLRRIGAWFLQSTQINRWRRIPSADFTSGVSSGNSSSSRGSKANSIRWKHVAGIFFECVPFVSVRSSVYTVELDCFCLLWLTSSWLINCGGGRFTRWRALS